MVTCDRSQLTQYKFRVLINFYFVESCLKHQKMLSIHSCHNTVAVQGRYELRVQIQDKDACTHIYTEICTGKPPYRDHPMRVGKVVVKLYEVFNQYGWSFTAGWTSRVLHIFRITCRGGSPFVFFGVIFVQKLHLC